MAVITQAAGPARDRLYVAHGTQPTAQAEANAQKAWDELLAATRYQESRNRFLDDLGQHAAEVPPHYPAFTEEHIEILHYLGYLD